MSEIANYLKYLRKKSSLSIRKVAQETGLSDSYLSQLEREVRKNPHPHILKKIAKCYGIPVIQFFHKAGYFEEDYDEVSPEEKVEKCFQYVISHPEHVVTRMGFLTYAGKKLVVQLYEKASGEKLL